MWVHRVDRWRGRRGRRRGFGDGTRGTMVEAHDKRQSVRPQTPHSTFREERQNHQSNSHQERHPFHQSRRRYQKSFRSHSRTSQDLGKKLASSPWGKGKGKGKGPAREVEQLKPLPGWEDWARGKKLRRRFDYDSN